MTFSILFIIWLAISLTIAIYGKISLKEFLIYLITCHLFIVGISFIYYVTMNYVVAPGISFIFPSKMNPSSWKESFVAGSIFVFFYSVGYMWFSHSVRKSDLEKLTLIMEGVKEIRHEIDNIVLETNRSKREGYGALDITVQLSGLQTKIHAIEKNMTPWLLRRLQK